jgi:hypothetical protein
MATPVKTPEDRQIYEHERNLMQKWRDAQSFCKELLSINQRTDEKMPIEDKVNFEKCLTENYLVKYGDDYFGKRDFLYIDLWGSNDIRRAYE